jgi:predicted dienelactone hydrolase
VRVPTLAIAGAQDAALPSAHSEQIARAIAGAIYELIDRAAHYGTIISLRCAPRSSSAQAAATSSSW